MIRKIKIFAATGAFLFVAASAHAITVAGSDPNSSAYVVTPGSYGNAYSGVAELTLVRPDLGTGVVEGCSGALLSDGISVLTAAHCLTDSTGAEKASSAAITFNGAGGPVTSQSSSFFVNPLYNGSSMSPYDVAIVKLSAPAPASVTRYSLYVGNTLDQVITLAGYGLGGTGTTGYNGADFPLGTLRIGQNDYTANLGPSELLYDFNNGQRSTDAFGSVLGPAFANTGLGTAAAMMAPGDSGGPSFINGQIAGVHSYVYCFSGFAGCGSSPSNANSSFGNFAADASVQYNAAFLQSEVATTAPEPSTALLLGLALVGIALLGQKRRNERKA